MDRVVGGGCRRAARIEEVVIGQKAVVVRRQARRYGESAEIIRCQQVGGFRRIVLDWLEWSDRCVDDVESIIRVRKVPLISVTSKASEYFPSLAAP